MWKKKPYLHWIRNFRHGKILVCHRCLYNKKRYLDSLAFTHKSRQRCMMVREQKSSRVFKVWTRHWVFIYWHPALDLTRVHESSWAREIFFVGKKVGMITKSENTREFKSARAWVDVRQQDRESWNYTLVKKIKWLQERQASVVLKEIAGASLRRVENSAWDLLSKKVSTNSSTTHWLVYSQVFSFQNGSQKTRPKSWYRWCPLLQELTISLRQWENLTVKRAITT